MCECTERGLRAAKTLFQICIPLNNPVNHWNMQVRSDCPPGLLLEFLASEAGLAASEAAEGVASSRAEEEALLQQARAAFPPAGVYLPFLVLGVSGALLQQARAAFPPAGVHHRCPGCGWHWCVCGWWCVPRTGAS